MSGKGEKIRVVGIPGSLRAEGFTRRVVAIALEGAAQVGAEVQLLELAGYDLPFVVGREDEDRYGPGVERFRADIAAAQGIILGTPEYHGSFSGVLKNALDLLGFDEMEGRMVGLVGVGGGRMGGAPALAALRVVGRSLHAWVVPSEAAVPQASRAFGPDGALADERMAERVREVGREVARFAYLHSSERSREFLRAWEGARENPGGEGR